MQKPSLVAAAAMLLAFASPAGARKELSPDPVGERVVDLPLGNGRYQRVLYDAPARPRATLVMLPGGTGNLGISSNGAVQHGDNFLVRTRAYWVSSGYAVLIPDTIDGTNLRGKRSSPAYGQLVDELVTYARSQVLKPAFLVGTSQGTIAAVNGAAHARPGSTAGLVLTESVSRSGRLSAETVFDAGLDAVRVPVLIIANRGDACQVAPPAMAPKIAAAITRSPDVGTLTVSGGIQRSTRACGSLSPHGYYGIEAQVLDAVRPWLRAHGG